MKYAGIDIGSRSIELVVADENGRVILQRRASTGFDPLAEAKKLIGSVEYDHIMATGYGRNLFELSFDSPTVTEIKAHATGVKALFPEAGTILDIGGQDSKAIALMENGRVRKFEMNDRCAAGTGKFLEIMAKTLGFDISEFGRLALASKEEMTISSMCTVFAESEVTSLIAKGGNRRAIARGLHAAIIRRTASMLNRLPQKDAVVFTGGVAKNPCMEALLSEALGRRVLTPQEPEFTGALGAALLALESNRSQRQG